MVTVHDVVSWCRNASPLCLALTLCGVAAFTIVFGVLAVDNHRNYGTWAYDGAIYDQGIWLVSRGQQTFMTVRGLDVWGHHFNLIFYALAPFYWFGAGPEFLFVLQNLTIALAALPVYLIARDRFGRPSIGLLFVVSYLMYAPIQWISWINFHPEAMCIAPFMFAWYFATKQQWRWFFVSTFLVLAIREDAALAVAMLAIVLFVRSRRDELRRPDARMAIATFGVAVAWYLLATQVVIPHFNHGDTAFYFEQFFAEWGGNVWGIAGNVLRHPDRVIDLAMEPDRTSFYYKLGLPLGGFAILSPLALLMAAPQMLASVIGDQTYAREIYYQYPSIMIAPIVIASIEGAHWAWSRFKFMKSGLYVWLLVAAYISNVAWSNSPIGNGFGAWFSDNPRREILDEAIDIVPGDAVVSSSYTIGPHLSQRERSYDWPNPFFPAFWAGSTLRDQDCTRFPSSSDVEYLVLDVSLYAAGDPNLTYFDALITNDLFEVVFNEESVVVAHRVSPGPDGEDVPVNCPGDSNSALALIDAAPITNPPASDDPDDASTPTVPTG